MKAKFLTMMALSGVIAALSVYAVPALAVDGALVKRIAVVGDASIQADDSLPGDQVMDSTDQASVGADPNEGFAPADEATLSSEDTEQAAEKAKTDQQEQSEDAVKDLSPASGDDD